MLPSVTEMAGSGLLVKLAKALMTGNSLNLFSEIPYLLFWTFRLCAWGEYENPFPYTLYKGLVDGRFEKFYDDYPDERKTFICIDEK